MCVCVCFAPMLATKEQLKGIEATISQGLDGLKLSALDELKASLDKVKLEINRVSGDIQRGNHIK